MANGCRLFSAPVSRRSVRQKGLGGQAWRDPGKFPASSDERVILALFRHFASGFMGVVDVTVGGLIEGRIGFVLMPMILVIPGISHIVGDGSMGMRAPGW